MKEHELLRLRKKIDTAKNDISEARGEKTQLMKQLKEKYGCDSIEDGETLVESLKAEISELEKQIQTHLDNLEDEYELIE